MPLNLNVGGEGDFTPYLKYNAKAGRFYVKPEGASEEVEISAPLLAFDMANIKTGWIFYQEGSGPERVWDASPSQAAPRPAGPRKFKRGFEVMVFGHAVIPNTNGLKIGLREFSSTAGNVITAIVRMHAEYEAGMAQHPDAIPVYGCDGVKPIVGNYGTNYEPLFSLKTWVARDKVPDFDTHRETAPAPSSAQTAPAAAPNGGYNELNPPPHDGSEFGLPARGAGSMKDQLGSFGA